MYRSILIWIILSCLNEATLQVSIGSRSILRTISDDGDILDAAVDLNSTNFDAVLTHTPATYAIVEFFAHWCPACRNYKPHYEKVARIFNGPDSVHPGMILMTRVDCALKINSKLCENFSVDHYPMLLWGPPSKFVSGRWRPIQEKSDIVLVDGGRTADPLLSWINNQLHSSYTLNDRKYENDHLSSNASDIEQIVQAIYDAEEATSSAFDIVMNNKVNRRSQVLTFVTYTRKDAMGSLITSFPYCFGSWPTVQICILPAHAHFRVISMIKSNTRASLVKFLQLLVAHHPSRRCRKGSAEILVNFADFPPLDLLSSDKLEHIGNGKSTFRDTPICGKEVPRGYWMFCRGSRNETRGFSCGLWVLLHSLSVRVEDGESQFAFTAICDFIHNFFICEECRQHFYQMCSSISTPFNTKSDFALSLWSAHNEVNKRLMKEEALSGTGDPKFPKIIWPPKQLCPSCFLSENQNGQASQTSWDRDEVFKFLANYYGKKIVSISKDKSRSLTSAREITISEDLVSSTNALVVPLGAALAIAIASCAFGALACYWRSHQKNRKQRRSWN